MSVLIVCFSSVSAFADTTVDNGSSSDFIKTKMLSELSDYSLSKLPVDDYLVILYQQAARYSKDGYRTDLTFIPKSAKQLVHVDYSMFDRYKTADDFRSIPNNVIYYSGVHTSTGHDELQLCFSGDYYELSTANNYKGIITRNMTKETYYLRFGSGYGFEKANRFSCNSSTIIDYSLTLSYFQHPTVTNDTGSYCQVISDSNLFADCTKVISGYTGAVYDNSLEEIFKHNGKQSDDSIIDKYKYQIYYSLNNDLRMVFLNNAYQPEYKKDKFQGSNSDDAYKYKFHYNKTSDCIVYYPTFKMYLSYDDWYKFQPEDDTFKWWWEEDTKDFTLISDWKYSNGIYTGTRVATNWEKLNQLGESADFTAISSFITDKDKLLNNGWKDGRPADTNYPYCIEVDYNGKAGLFIYSNSKPKVSKVDIISDTHKQFNIYMIGMYGYVYNAINDCYINYDFTIKDGQKNFVQQYLFKYFSYELHCLDSDLNLTLFENYKGSDNDYKGTRVFFNWDITQDLKLSADDLQKIQNNCKENIGAFTDSNGNHHGGNLNNYSDEDKNKFNESGSNSDSTTDNNFDFSFNGIMNYCDSFFSFIQSAFSVFPASIWLLISLSIAMLVFLRVLGR